MPVTINLYLSDSWTNEQVDTKPVISIVLLSHNKINSKVAEPSLFCGRKTNTNIPKHSEARDNYEIITTGVINYRADKRWQDKYPGITHDRVEAHRASEFLQKLREATIPMKILLPTSLVGFYNFLMKTLVVKCCKRLQRLSTIIVIRTA